MKTPKTYVECTLNSIAPYIGRRDPLIQWQFCTVWFSKTAIYKSQNDRHKLSCSCRDRE